MAIISVLYRGETLDVVQLAAGAVTIGRAQDNKIRLDDKTVSAHHAQIVTYFNASYIEDLGSTNGTTVNGKKVQMQVLHPGDTVIIGRHEFKVEEEAMEDRAIA